ncbi:MAG: FkbM family methyltransferase [Candidatus Symbiothrix sp.]|nr:FkbM family methyltransferase [Candidatus Symbiothrix sp.]
MNKISEWGRNVYITTVPFEFQLELWRFRDPEKYKKLKSQEDLRKRIVKYLQQELRKQNDIEKQEVLQFLKHHALAIFNDNFSTKCIQERTVYKDAECNMNYVLHENKRLYFPREWDNTQIQEYYNGLLIEQDIDSPHRYEAVDFHVQDNDAIADVGTAEGIFALTNVEKASKIYLFECEEKWIEALQKTFEPWKEKVSIINNYVSDVNNEKCITLDTFFNDKQINFIKADIEGAERQLLLGAKKLMTTQKNLRITICAYHQADDALVLNQILQEQGFNTAYSKGYMILIPPSIDLLSLTPLIDYSLAPPYLRRGVIRATKS